MYEVVKVLNNNTILAHRDNEEVIVMYKGIGFGKKAGGQTKTLIIETPPVASYCPICGFRMHSRGVKKRTINHPILQDGYSLIRCV